MKFKLAFNSFYLLSGILLLILTLISGCGRKGDPVPIIPPKEAAEKGSGGLSSADTGAVSVPAVNKTGLDDDRRDQPSYPAGLTAVSTESSIVLAWDEVMGQGVKYYNIYRSSGGDYTVIGKTGVPAYTDKNIESGRKYYYKVSSVSGSEGPLSKEIEVMSISQE